MTATAAPAVLPLGPLHQLFASATHDASAAMCRWTNGLITLTLDEVRRLPLEQISELVSCGDELLTMVVVSLEGEIGGQIILCFDDLHGRQLAASLLGSSFNPADPWSALGKSALLETGNILACAYLNALTRLIDTELIPLPPYFVRDFGASVLEQALMAQAMASDEVLIGRTYFHRQGQQLDWSVFFVPTEAMRQRMEQAFQRP